MGDPVGTVRVSLVGTLGARGVGASDGTVVGIDVPPAKQELALGSTQTGEKLSYSSRVSNTDANSHRLPVLFCSKLSILVKPLPNTTTLETPTRLLLKHVLSILTGPKDSTIKLFVSAC